MNHILAKEIRIGVLVSGSGSNLQAIIDASKKEILDDAEVAVVISNKKESFALKRAEKENIPALFIDPKLFGSRTEYYEKIIREFNSRNVDLICLAGFLLKLESNIIEYFKNKILNIHPALLPKFGGKGMYGHFVHEAVLKSGEKESGCTVHLVDDEFDHGRILMQRKVPVMPNDTPKTLAERVLKEEHILYPQTIARFIRENLKR